MGIFRLPGQASRVQDLKELYDQGKHCRLIWWWGMSTCQLSPGCQQDFPASEDVHTVASLLKLYLRELPEPLVPFVSYGHFQSAVKSKCSCPLRG